MDNELRDDVVSAAIDGERVDMDALRDALRTEDGRETLAAFVLLRAATAADEVLPTIKAAEFPGTGRTFRLWGAARSRLRLAAAVAVVLLALLVSFWFGTTRRGPVSTVGVVAPPTAPAMVSAPPTSLAPTGMVPGIHPMPTIAHAADAAPTRMVWEPPKPTRMLSFVPGVDWTSAPE